jgi:hypothetical protein
MEFAERCIIARALARKGPTIPTGNFPDSQTSFPACADVRWFA